MFSHKLYVFLLEKSTVYAKITIFPTKNSGFYEKTAV